MSEIRKIGGVVPTTEEALAQASEDFIAVMGMTPDEFYRLVAEEMTRAFDALVIDE